MFPPNVLWSVQSREMIEHKYFLSQKAGCDVGPDYSAMDWALAPDYDHSQAARFRKAAEEHEPRVLELCKRHCGGYDHCVGPENCPLSLDEVHWALEDFPKEKTGS